VADNLQSLGELTKNMNTVRNKQVEIIDRIQALEERVQELLTRYRPLEERIVRLEKSLPSAGTRYGR
jgi:predicted  nucleic acid-binding Zn-ribbon protein